MIEEYPLSAAFLPPIADPALYYPVVHNSTSSGLHHVVGLDTRAELDIGKKIMEEIAMSLFRKYRIPCPWCDLLLRALLSSQSQQKMFSKLAQHLPQAQLYKAAFVNTFQLSIN
jgi:hypothetical protein